jgi:hypothetical protein
VSLNHDGIRYAQSTGMMELLGRLGVALGISLVLTLLLLVLYQDDAAQTFQPQSTTLTQTVAAGTVNGAP